MQTSVKMAESARELAALEQHASLRADQSNFRRNANYVAYVTAYPLTLLEAGLMAFVAVLHYWTWRLIYARAWYPDTARQKPARMVKAPIDAGNALGVMETLENIGRSTRAEIFWLSGTLLGLQRLGRPLPHDNDLDVGIHIDDPHYRDFLMALWKSPDVASIEPQFLSLKCQMQNPDLHVVPGGIIRYKAAVANASQPDKPPVKVDVFLHFDYRGGAIHGSRNSLWWNSPFEVVQKQFGARQFSVPRDAHLHLTENYGAYQDEVKDFENSIDCPNAMNIFSWQSLVYLLSRQQMLLCVGRKSRIHEINRRIRGTILKGIIPPRKPTKA